MKVLDKVLECGVALAGAKRVEVAKRTLASLIACTSPSTIKDFLAGKVGLQRLYPNYIIQCQGTDIFIQWTAMEAAAPVMSHSVARWALPSSLALTVAWFSFGGL